MTNVKLAVDHSNGLAYITLSTNAIARSVEHDENIIVDLDDLEVAVGIELLDLDAKIPFDALTTSYHVASSVVDILRIIQPTINQFVLRTSSPVPAHHETAPADSVDSEIFA